MSIPRSLKSAEKDVDIEWEFLENEIISFQGAIFEFCLDYYASYGSEGSQIEITRSLNTYDDFIAGFEKKKRNRLGLETLKRWLIKVSSKAIKKIYLLIMKESLKSRKYIR